MPKPPPLPDPPFAPEPPPVLEVTPIPERAAPRRDAEVTVTLPPTRGTPASPETAARRSAPAAEPRRPTPYPNAPFWAITPGPDWPWHARHHPEGEGLPPRYMFGREIGRGGQGRILTVFDMDLGRQVAMKSILAGHNAGQEVIRRFIHEVQITGQLEHPNIIPVHELGQLANGDIFYTMKLVEGRTLAEVIHDLAEGKAEAHAEFGRVRLITILQQICQGVAFAHARGVVHRDLKPSNIMLGKFGEVTVMDWGCAKVRGTGANDGLEPRSIVTDPQTRDPEQDWTIMGTVQGTPAYMAPEQAAGAIDRIDERTDVYALGAILYEILTYHPPVEGPDVSARLEAVKRQAIIPPRHRRPDLEIPVELEDICLRCLARDPAARYASAQDLNIALESYLEGTLAHERRSREATAIAARGRTLCTRYTELSRQVERLRANAVALQEQIEPWEPVERKAALWQAHRRLEQAEVLRITTLGAAVNVFHQALSHDPQNREARASLARLYWSQFQDAEQRRHRHEMLYFEALVREFDDGSYAAALEGDGVLSLTSRPSGARVKLYRYQETGRRLRPKLLKSLGVTPIIDLRLPRGSYLLVLSFPGRSEARVPIHLSRQETLVQEVHLLEPDALPAGYAYIPAGPFLAGGDPEISGGLEASTRWLEEYAIQRHPVTCAEYLEFLEAVARIDPDAARQRLPRSARFQAYYWSFSPEGSVRLPERDEHGNPWEARWPVFGISWEDAEAYCRWRSERLGRSVRLPTGTEWEKAARGVDGRYFPWGDSFDPTFCKMRESREHAAIPEPVGSFSVDESPYGVRDVAGCIAEWCADWYNRKQGLREVRGGAWNSSPYQCRPARRHGESAIDVLAWVGFRTVLELHSPPGGSGP